MLNSAVVQQDMAVSVIMAAKDAMDTLPRALQSIAAQSYPHIVEIVVAAGDPDTAKVAAEHGATVVDNPAGTTPAGLNQALRRSTGQVVVRCDAHAIFPAGYVSRAVETLERTGAASVGGMQVPVGDTFWERAIAAAMASPAGAGDARYRIGGEEGPAETVYLGVFSRVILERLEGYDESFLRNQDYELNHRIRESGGVVWFDPELKVEYRPRGSLAALARKYFRYGQAKRQFARKHRRALRWRQLAPPLLVVVLAASLLVSPWFGWALLVPGAYLSGLILAGSATVKRTREAAFGVPFALAAMHLSWGLGWWFSPRERTGTE